MSESAMRIQRALARAGIASRRKAEELVAMNLVMEIHDAQLDQATVKDLEQAMDIVKEDFRTKRMRAVKEKV